MKNHRPRMAKGIIESGRCENNAQHAAENGNQATRVVVYSTENPPKCGSAIRVRSLFPADSWHYSKP